MSSKVDIPLHGPSVNIVRRCGATLTNVLQSKFGCVATIEGVDCEGDPGFEQQKSPIVAPEKRFSIALGLGVQVSVWKADLASVSMDAIANTANCHLQHRGGLALALSSAGGPQIQKESDDYIRKYGALSVGDAVVMDAGLLPCKKIIHVAGPELPIRPDKNRVSQADPFLRKAFLNIIKRAKENHLQTVTLPVLSSELFNHPLSQCAHAIVTAVRQYCELPSGDHPKEILFVSHDDHTVKEMEKACHLLLAPHLKYSHAAASESKANPQMSTPTVRIGTVHLTLRQGHIEDQQADVIVNSVRSRNLSVGQISNALLQKAGPRMQLEMEIAPTIGNIIITHGYQLQCKEVYHTCCRGKGRGQMEQILFTSVLECLQLAVSHHHKSIAFPAISAGALGFDGKDVARVMSSAVANFAHKFQKEMEVYCVIFPSDNEMFKAFEEQMKHLIQKSSDLNVPNALHPTDDLRGSRASGPQIRLCGPSDIATREAERWLRSLLFTGWKTLPICNNFVLILDEHEHLQLTSLMNNGITIREVVERGRASVVVDGDSSEDVVVAGLQVEAMLCSIQNEFVREEAHSMMLMSGEEVSFKRVPVELSSEFLDRASAFTNTGLRIVKVDRVENRTLTMLFDLKKKQLRLSTSRQMFQRIPVQFCDMVSHIGFHAEYAPPTDPAYGDGMYFTSSVRKAMDVWKDPHWEYLHFVEAEVLTGAATPGKPGLILPPTMVTDPRMTYDSVSGGPEISVIFCGHQALPKYIIICTTEG